MSTTTAFPEQQTAPTSQQSAHGKAASHATSELRFLRAALEKAQGKIAPVWPLKDYVAVNPYAGLSDHGFLEARQFLRTVSDLETLMPVDYYREQLASGLLSKSEIDAALDELVADGTPGAERIDSQQLLASLGEDVTPRSATDAEGVEPVPPPRRLRTLAETLDQSTGSNWCRSIQDEICKHCSAYYDEGQAMWSSPWQDLSLYQAWQNAARQDRSFEILGVAGFRGLVIGLPHDPHAALVVLLKRLGVPAELWPDLLLCVALSMPGWSAWTKYQHRQAERRGEANADFAALLAMRLAYEAALGERLNFHVHWASFAEQHAANSQVGEPCDDGLHRLVLLKASEIAYRQSLLRGLSSADVRPWRAQSKDRRLAQMVFCIDVRSERIRRHLEATSSNIETFGFAGFFGLPIEFIGLGEKQGSSQVPVLISPQFKVYEEIEAAGEAGNDSAIGRRTAFRFLRKSWKDFQASAVSTFASVETTGLFYGFKLVARSLGRGQAWTSRFDGIAPRGRSRLSPTLRGLSQQGLTTSKQADLAESVLRGIGITGDFARLVVFCGHGSQTENNPLQAGLDCGACGGHSGEANARFAAKLLNQKYIRQALAQRGIAIPEDTQFVAALHNTTTDELHFFDTHDLSTSQSVDLEELRRLALTASQRTRSERLTHLPGPNTDDLLRRSRDWSEVRPEWGLAGNAAFIAAPRELTETISLDGRSFLHSYDYRKDAGFAVLEQIMTAPMIVAHWINMQYYASTVDPNHFGSGNKTVHNVVGRFGILSGNGGDLMTGLPWQSVHDGSAYRHQPLRLLAVLAAPREAIAAIIARHEVVANLLAGGWLQLLAVEDGSYYRYTARQTWEELPSSPSHTSPPQLAA